MAMICGKNCKQGPKDGQEGCRHFGEHEKRAGCNMPCFRGENCINEGDLKMSMSLNEYQKQIVEVTAKYPGCKTGTLAYPTLGLCGESGEVAEKVKKILRDKNGIISSEDKLELIKELGDIAWYLGAICMELNIPMQQIIDTNAEKLLSRMERGKISGSGDNR